MSKFKKKQIIKKVKGVYKNLSLEQRQLQFQMAWEGVVPKNAKGFLAKVGNVASSKTPGRLYAKIKEDLGRLITLKNKVDLNTINDLRKSLLDKAYSYSKYAKVTKHLTEDQVEQYRRFSLRIDEILDKAQTKTMNDTDVLFMKKTILADIIESEITEMNKMMNDFGLLD